jgi:hypothetical protein
LFARSLSHSKYHGIPISTIGLRLLTTDTLLTCPSFLLLVDSIQRSDFGT